MWVVAWNADHSLETKITGIQEGANAEPGRIRWWDSEPGMDRVDYGVAARVDRLKALGNGQVPRVAAAAWRILTHNA